VRRPPQPKRPRPDAARTEPGSLDGVDRLLSALRSGDEGRRTAAAVAALVVADEHDRRFRELLAALSDDERALVIGSRLDRSRRDPNPTRRLQRLLRLVTALPSEQRVVYWSEAAALATRGGDDAQLELIGFARGLPTAARTQLTASLQRSAARVRNPYKRAMALVALADIGGAPTADDAAAARRSAARIPDATLREAALVHLRNVGKRS
jgi:hypothetical protein